MQLNARELRDRQAQPGRVAAGRLGERACGDVHVGRRTDSTLAILLGSTLDRRDPRPDRDGEQRRRQDCAGRSARSRSSSTTSRVRAAQLKNAQSAAGAGRRPASGRPSSRSSRGLAERQQLLALDPAARSRGSSARRRRASGAARGRGQSAAAEAPARRRSTGRRSRPQEQDVVGASAVSPDGASRSRRPRSTAAVVGIAMRYLGTPVRLGRLLAGRLRLLRPRDVRLLAGRRLAPAPRGRPVQLRGPGLARRSSSPATSSSSTGSATSGSTSAAASSSTPRTPATWSRSQPERLWYAATYVGARYGSVVLTVPCGGATAATTSRVVHAGRSRRQISRASREVLLDDAPPQLQRRRDLALLGREVPREDREALDLLEA